MAKLFNRAKMDTSTTGSGTITLGSAVDGYQSFADAGVADSDVVQYVIEDGNSWEIGTGTYSATGTSLTRTPSESSNSGSAISLTGAAEVFITAVADDLNRLQNAGTTKVEATSTGATVTGNITVTGTVDGRDIASDGSKLDGIESGATADQTKADIDALGINADQVDGVEASQFIRSDANDTGTGSYSTTGTYWEVKGDGGSVAMTTNDGYGNANLTFNHRSGTPDKTGSSARIEAAVDGSTGSLSFEVGNNVTAGTATGITQVLNLTTSGATILGNTAWHAGNDGSGSGLDADTLDGVQGSSFLRSDADDTLTGNLQINSHVINMDLNNINDNAIDMVNVRSSTWPFEFTTYSVGNDNSSGFWVGSNGYPDMRLRRENSTVRALISSWEESFVSNGFSVTGDLSVTSDNGITVHSSTNGAGAKITFSDNTGGSYAQYGTLTYYHADGTVSSEPQTSNDGWIFAGTEPNTVVRVQGDVDVDQDLNVNNDIYVGDQIIHVGDTNTYMQFHAADQWRVVTGGSERLEVNNTNTTVANTLLGKNATFDNGTSTTVNIKCDNAGNARLNLCGDSQGTGILFVGQSTSYGGGIQYNGDNSPSFDGSGADYISLYRIAAGTVSWTARNYYSNTDWQFRGNITAYASDERLKENITPITDAVEKVKLLNGVTYDWIDECEGLGFQPSMKHETGVIAQDVQKVIPDAVTEAPFNSTSTEITGEERNYLTVDKEKIIPLLIEAIKEQQQKIEALQEAINGLTN